MKRAIVFGLLIVFLTPLFSSDPVASGASNTRFGNYSIKLGDTPFTLTGKELKTYLITYDNSDIKILVVIDQTEEGTKFISISDTLTVQYYSKGDCFGIEPLSREYTNLGLSASISQLDRFQYFHQRVIISWNTNEVEKLTLIASYFPLLLKEQSNEPVSQ